MDMGTLVEDMAEVGDTRRAAQAVVVDLSMVDMYRLDAEDQGILAVDRHCDADLAIVAAVGSGAAGIALAVLGPAAGMLCFCRPWVVILVRSILLGLDSPAVGIVTFEAPLCLPWLCSSIPYSCRCADVIQRLRGR
jgi:hypothetical protein